MGKTIRVWHKPQFRFRMGLDEVVHYYLPWKGIWVTYYPDPVWMLNSMQVFGRHKVKRVRKEMRHSIRCQNRIRFAHGWYELFVDDVTEYFD